MNLRGFVLPNVTACLLVSLSIISWEGVALAQSDSSSVSTPAPETREELAEPPVGKIRKIHLRALKGFDDEIQKRIDKSSKAKDAAKFAASLRSLKTKAQKATASLNKEDLFDVIPDMATVYQEQNKGDVPEDDDNFTYIERAKHTIQSLNLPVLNSMAEYIKENKGSLTNEMASKFTTVFLVKGFILECDWEDEDRPIGGSDIFVANPISVVERLKASPWQRVQQFIGGDDMTSTRFFAQYEPNGAGMPVLKAKYLAEKAEIFAKFDEIKKWVLQQEQAKAR